MKAEAIEYKIENIKKYIQIGFNEYVTNGNCDTALNNLRKSCEAISRAIILKKMNARDGMKVVLGEIDINKKPRKRKSNGEFNVPMLADLLFYLDNQKWIDKAIYYRFQDIRYGGNNASHDAVSVNKEVSEDDLTLCIEQVKWILKWFWSKILKSPIPQNLILSKKIQSPIIPENELVWNDFFTQCNYFSNEQRFVLVSPSSLEKSSQNELVVLSRIKWSLIIDFDFDSKKSGLYRAASQAFTSQQIRLITIEEKEKREEIISNSNYALNWFFANGLESIPSTISKTIREWRTTLKYASFTRRLIKEFLNEKIKHATFVYFLEDIQYLQTIIQAVDENVSNTKLVKHLIIYNNNELLPRLEDEFQQYDAKFFKLPLSTLIAGINRSINNENSNNTKLLLQIPSRGENDEDTFFDISNKYLSFLDRDVEVLHQGIATEMKENVEDGAFYKGNTITWKELAIDLDSTRNMLDEVVDSNQKWLDAPKGAYVNELHHSPGGGGTTLARRVAFKFHKKYPSIIINKYHREKTNQAIFDLAEWSRKPVFAVIEAYQVTQNELNSLVRQINEAKKHVVILYVSRTFNSNLKSRKDSKTLFLSDKMLDLNERNRFTSKYLQIAPKQSKEAVLKLGERNPRECELIDFVITAWEDEYSAQKVEDYISHYLDKLPQNHLQFAGYSSLVYYYTQNSTLDLWFSSIFANGSLSSDYNLTFEDEKYLNKLFINEVDDQNELTNYWRPRFSLFASEIVKLVLVGLNTKQKHNWKDYLSRWSIDLIKDCRTNHEYLTDDLRELFKSLFLNRDHEDVLGIDESYDNSNINDNKFASIIKHIANKEQQLAIFQTLVGSYPEEAHFRGHLGRFMYEKATTPREFDDAYNEITIALEIGDNDYNLWHIKGMCNRRKIEFLVRSNIEAYNVEEKIDLEFLIKELAEEANTDFEKSRSFNPFNLHSHTAQIQMLIQVIDFGRQLSKATNKVDFIADKENEWYETQLEQVFDLLDEARYILELSRDIDQSKYILKSKRMIDACEAKLFGLIGDYSKAIDKFRSLSEVADRSIRPYFRKMFVFSTLATKVSNVYSNYKLAWSKLSNFEYETLKKAIESNIREQPENSSHIKLWLQAVRYSKNYVSLEECFNTVKIWYDNSAKFEIAHLEATYYLYVIAACKAISDGDSIDSRFAAEARRYIIECKEKKANDKFSFEWFGQNTGIKKLVNHSSLGKMSSEKRFFEARSTALLGRAEGTITNIYDRQKGKITLKCGLEAFFVPSMGGFMKTIDETTEVDFFIGFRQDGLFAWEVKHHWQPEDESRKLILDDSVEIENFDSPSIDDEILEPEQIEIAKKEQAVTIYETQKEKLEGVKVVGKIDITQFKREVKKKGDDQ